MKVLVDTSVWSLVLRRSKIHNREMEEELSALIDEARVEIIGPIRQEILSGIKSQSQFQKLRFYLSAFPDLKLTERDFEQAAEYFNRCRAKGIQGSNTDFLICSAAVSNDLEIFTLDDDFKNFQKFISIKFYKSRFLKS